VVATVPIPWIGVQESSANFTELEDEVEVKENIILRFLVM